LFCATNTSVWVAKAWRGVNERFFVEKKDSIQLGASGNHSIVIVIDLGIKGSRGLRTTDQD
jgi:hypothetical protein